MGGGELLHGFFKKCRLNIKAKSICPPAGLVLVLTAEGARN